MTPARLFAILPREVRPRWTLRKTAIASNRERSPTGALYWERHAPIGPDGETPLNADWAEIHDRSIVFARDGCLWRMPVHARGPGEALRLLDTNPMRPRPLAAPYAGIGRERQP